MSDTDPCFRNPILVLCYVACYSVCFGVSFWPLAPKAMETPRSATRQISDPAQLPLLRALCSFSRRRGVPICRDSLHDPFFLTAYGRLFRNRGALGDALGRSSPIRIRPAVSGCFVRPAFQCLGGRSIFSSIIITMQPPGPTGPAMGGGAWLRLTRSRSIYGLPLIDDHARRRKIVCWCVRSPKWRNLLSPVVPQQ